MKALVVYESMFGNTEAVAGAVADGLADAFAVTLADVSTMPSPAGVDLLVAGAPTHAFGLSRPGTRRDAAKRAEVRPGSVPVGLREYLDLLPDLDGLPAAAFDTRVASRLSGSAARRAHRRLRRLGCRLLLPAKGFEVVSVTGPLADHELQNARRWGLSLSAVLLTRLHEQQVG